MNQFYSDLNQNHEKTMKEIINKNIKQDQAMDSINFLANLQQLNLASKFAEKLFSRLEQFNSELDEEHQVGIKLSFGQSITIHVVDIGYYNPSLIMFSGIDEKGDKVELLQHISQISFLLIQLKRTNTKEPKRKIGFIQNTDI